MSSFRQIEANRRNASKSSGPTTEEGKRRSRCNAVRHGLTAETVIGALEDAEDYKAFEAAIIADYDAQSAVERELVLRLASLLWRLRRATIMETGLFEIQADHLIGFRQGRQGKPASPEFVYALFGRADPVSFDPTSHGITNGTEKVTNPGSKSVESPLEPNAELARCFLRLANLPNFALDRLSRYEATMWRQAGRILFALDALDRRKPQERRRRFFIDIRTAVLRAQSVLIFERDRSRHCALTLPEPRRTRDKDYVRLVAQQACLVCGRKPSDPHHLRYMQPRTLGRKVSDEFTVPLCRIHHRTVHCAVDERAWWKETGIDPSKVARMLWKKPRVNDRRFRPDRITQETISSRNQIA